MGDASTILRRWGSGSPVPESGSAAPSGIATSGTRKNWGVPVAVTVWGDVMMGPGTSVQGPFGEGACCSTKPPQSQASVVAEASS